MSDEELRETIRLLLQMKLEALRMTAETSMLWWVSAILFCGYAVSAIWFYRDEVKKIPRMDWFFAFVFLFFCSIVIYGCWIFYSLFRLRAEAVFLLNQLNIPDVQLFEFTATTVAVGIGTTSFMIVVAIWIVMWKHLRAISREHVLPVK